MLEKLQILRDEGELTAYTWDSLGGQIEVALTTDETKQMAAILDKAKTLRPKWEQDVERAKEATKQALASKTQAEKAKAAAIAEKAEAVEAKTQAEAEKTKAVMAKTKAETDRDQALAKAKEWQDKLAEYLTGGAVDHVDDETILLYAEWQEGLAVDAGDWYRVGLNLIRAKVDHVTAPENAPESEQGADYWEGVPFAQEPTVKYPKGKVIEWSGIQYKALVDTDKDPGEAPESWEIVDND